jgi:glutathione peroxidase
MTGETLYDIEVTTIDGVRHAMSDYRGRTLLIVNVASQCGYTPQYAGLETLYRTFEPRGFVVLGFPCDQFGHQEPGSEDDIQAFCRQQYDVTFPLFSKVKVNGPDAHPLFRFLTAARAGLFGSRSIKWNFTKFLITPAGEVRRRYGSRTPPDAIRPDIEEILAR